MSGISRWHCWMCERGPRSRCETTQNCSQGKGASLFGYPMLYGQVPGGQAEYLMISPEPGADVRGASVKTTPGPGQGWSAGGHEGRRGAARPAAVVSRKIGAPGNPEYGLGAVTDDGPPRYDDSALAALGLTALLQSVAIGAIKRRPRLLRLAQWTRLDRLSIALLRRLRRHGPGPLVLPLRSPTPRNSTPAATPSGCLRGTSSRTACMDHSW